MSPASELLALLEGFHISDRALLRARDRVLRGEGAQAETALREALRRYFGTLEREAVEHLKHIDRKLDDLYQRQYNLQAERGVAERRLAGARRVLRALDRTGAEAATGA